MKVKKAESGGGYVLPKIRVLLVYLGNIPVFVRSLPLYLPSQVNSRSTRRRGATLGWSIQGETPQTKRVFYPNIPIRHVCLGFWSRIQGTLLYLPPQEQRQHRTRPCIPRAILGKLGVRDCGAQSQQLHAALWSGGKPRSTRVDRWWWVFRRGDSGRIRPPARIFRG